jgi:tetratricopeptide (TPR) repeat protein
MTTARRLFVLFWLGVFAITAGQASPSQDPFNAANDAYSNGKYEEAKVEYLHLVQEGIYTPDLFYNLGNAWFKLGDYGRAILNYNRALLLDRNFPEAESNLKTTLKIVGNSIPNTLQNKLANYADQFPVITSIGLWILIFLFTYRLLSGKRTPTALWIVSAVAIIVTLGGASLSLWIGKGAKDPEHGLVVETLSDLKYGPAVSARTIETLRVGDPVKLISQRGEWTFCKAGAGNIGWILTQKVESLAP